MEKKYEKTLEKARQEYNTTENVERKQWLEELFPELKESEDERIRKEIIEYIKTGTYHKSWLAWLEKQGEQKKSHDTCDSSMINKKSPYGEKRDFGYFEEKSANKVEPKFHEGDWTVDKCGKVNQITSVRNKGYDFANGDYMSYESAHKELRLWNTEKTLSDWWIARDEDDELYIYNTKPQKSGLGWYDSNNGHCEIPKELFPDLKWEDEPLKVDVIIKPKN